jgi:putative effector of murein hydrolase
VHHSDSGSTKVNTGAGTFIALPLNPAIIAFAFPTSSALPLLRGKELQILGMSLIAAVINCFSMTLLGYLIVNDEQLALPLLLHSESTAVALGMVSDINCASGNTCSTTSITAATCIMTGTLGYVVGVPLLDYLGFGKEKNKACRAIAMSTTSSALGVTALRLNGEEAASGLAAISYMAYAVWLTVIIMTSRFFQDAITSIPGK